MDMVLLIAVLASSAIAGILALGVMASRIDNAQRLSDLVRSTRRIRAEVAAQAPPPRTRRR